MDMDATLGKARCDVYTLREALTKLSLREISIDDAEDLLSSPSIIGELLYCRNASITIRGWDSPEYFDAFGKARPEMVRQHLFGNPLPVFECDEAVCTFRHEDKSMREDDENGEQLDEPEPALEGALCGIVYRQDWLGRRIPTRLALWLSVTLEADDEAQ